MADIKVHVLNFHGITSHIEIVLEDISSEPHEYLFINRWIQPEAVWNTTWASKEGSLDSEWHKETVGSASARFSFILHDADKKKITDDWIEYSQSTWKNASVFGDNCAVAAQWFLRTFAGVDDPNMWNISFNHLALGVVWPSFIPCPITLPGRIMSNLKFHIRAKEKGHASESYHATSRYVKAFRVFFSAVLTIILSPITFLFMACFLAAKLLNTLSALSITDFKEQIKSLKEPPAANAELDPNNAIESENLMGETINNDFNNV